MNFAVEKLNEYEPFIDTHNSLRKSYKHNLLFVKIDEVIYCVICNEYSFEGLDFYNKNGLEYDIKTITLQDFEDLKQKIVEIDNDTNFSSFDSDNEIGDEIDLNSFLKTNEDILTDEKSAPIIKFVNSIFLKAVKEEVSDIHIESHEKESAVKFRINGQMVDRSILKTNVMQLVVNRIKVISGLDITKKRVPQDGRATIVVGNKKLDLRVSILPTFFGERVVLRILIQSDKLPPLETLGFQNEISSKLLENSNKSHGMVLVTGPTGSGKSTTLHSIIKLIEDNGNIITIEDPVEYLNDKINQIQVNKDTGLTFAEGLRSILRQDPDIIMLGEIRDLETANIAVQSSLTGHLVLSTLHTNTAEATIARLFNMGVEPFLVSSAVNCILSQRLTKILCKKCKEKTDFTNTVTLDKLGFNSEGVEFYKSVGCKHCNFSGIENRRAVGELLVFSPKIKEAVTNGLNEHEILKIAKQEGFISLFEKLNVLLTEGDITPEEFIKLLNN